MNAKVDGAPVPVLQSWNFEFSTSSSSNSSTTVVLVVVVVVIKRFIWAQSVPVPLAVPPQCQWSSGRRFKLLSESESESYYYY